MSLKRVVIVQARMTSTRLPGKVLKDLCGRPMLAQQVRRLRECRQVDEIVLATTTNGTDDPLVALATAEGIGCFRGSEHDVLSRYTGAARSARADVVVRVTSDCPLIDPALVDRVIDELVSHSSECDYAANVLERTYPRGLDVEAFWRDTLERMDRLATSGPAREHVTILPRSERPELFLVRSVTDDVDNSDLRWTVDTPEDLEVVRRVYEGLRLNERTASYREVLDWMRERPEIASLNQAVETWNPR